MTAETVRRAVEAAELAVVSATPDPEGTWPSRGQLPLKSPAVPSLPAEMVPAALRTWLTDTALRASIPLEYVACPAVAALGAVVGRSIGVRPERYDNWLVVPNLWGAIIGPPGSMKSAAVNEGLRPLNRLAGRAREAFESKRDRAAAEQEIISAEIAATKKDLAAALKKGADTARFVDGLADLNARQRQGSVTERRYVTQDSTVEKLGELLQQNPRGLMVVRDELAGWGMTLEKPGREGDREFYLEAWNGDGRYTFDRIGRGTIHIDALTLGLFGGIQPGKLTRWVRGALGNDAANDGLVQRLQLVVWPDALGEWKPVKTWPDSAARNRAFDVFDALDALDPCALGANIRDGEIPWLAFTEDAQALFDAWRFELEHRLRSRELDATPAFASHLAKYRSLMLSLALLFHLVDVVGEDANGPIGLAAARQAAAWCEFLEAHARKLYSAEIYPGVGGAQTLAEKIAAGALRDGESVRDIYRHHWSGLDTAASTDEALAVLQAAAWIRVEVEGDGGGRPSEVVRLHPDLRQALDA
jgi:Protein of unknown function (DUF3987)